MRTVDIIHDLDYHFNLISGHFTDEQSKYIIKYNNNSNPTWSSANFVMQNLKMAGEHFYIWMEDEFSVQQLKDKVKNLKKYVLCKNVEVYVSE